VRGVGEACKLSLPSPLLHLRGPSRFTSNATGLLKIAATLAHLGILAHDLFVLSLPPSIRLKKEGRNEERERERKNKQGKY
jgi:hypothetical protein